MSPSSTSMSLIMNSPMGKHMGVLPAQQPPDCTNITWPPRAARRAVIALRAARGGRDACRNDRLGHQTPLEEAERLGAVADQQVLRLAVMIEHHPVVLPADAGDLVTTERRTCRIRVVAVRPDAARLDLAAHLVGPVPVAGPDAGAQAVEGVVGDGQRLLVVLEGGDRQHRAEDLLLEHPHLVVALEHSRLVEVAGGELPVPVSYTHLT